MISKKDKTKLEKFGFDLTGDLTINTYKRLIMAIAAHEKCGKTTFALTAPKNIMYFNFDRKIEQATLDNINVDRNSIFIKEIRVRENQAQDLHRKQWDEVKEAFLWALSAESIKSIVIDTESEMWELARFAYFGRASNVAHLFTPLNAMYKNMLDQVDKHNKNVILLRKFKKQFVKLEKLDNKGNEKEAWNGKYEYSGFGKLKDIAQINATMYRNTVENNKGEKEDSFVFEILNNGLKASLNHETFVDEMCSFPWVASMLTDSSPEDWE